MTMTHMTTHIRMITARMTMTHMTHIRMITAHMTMTHIRMITAHMTMTHMTHIITTKLRKALSVGSWQSSTWDRMHTTMITASPDPL